MEANEILKWCLTNYDDLVCIESWGEQALFYNPGNRKKRGVYVVTIKAKDGENDNSSNLDREGVYRLNIGVPKERFQKIFTTIPKRPAKGGCVDMKYDFTKKDVILPHPVYGWMGWICILNPSVEMFEQIKPFLTEAYEWSKKKFLKSL